MPFWSNLEGSVGGLVLDQLAASGFELPTGYRLELGGAVEQESQATGDLAKYVPVLLTLTVACLVLLFRSASLAALLGLVAFLSVGLGLLATWIAGFPFSFNTLLGTLGLVGLAFNNSIVVLAAIRANPDAAGGDPDAIVAAVMGWQNPRPRNRSVIPAQSTLQSAPGLSKFSGRNAGPALESTTEGALIGISQKKGELREPQ